MIKYNKHTTSLPELETQSRGLAAVRHVVEVVFDGSGARDYVAVLTLVIGPFGRVEVVVDG